MNSLYMMQDTIKEIIKENQDNKYFMLLDKWNTVKFNNGKTYKVKIVEETEE